MEAQTFVPNEFYCPITGDLMIDPVSDPMGHSYEKASIITWLETSNTSPITRMPLEERQLTENIALKRSISSIREKITEDQLKIDSRICDEEQKQFIDVLDTIELKSYYLNDKLFINIKAPNVEVRPPFDIVLCIDISGSMATEATLKGDQNETIRHGFSILSLTVSAAKTVLHSLNDNDNISIVTYSERATVIIEQTACTVENKGLIGAQLDELKPTYSTNMWDGIHTSLDILRKKSPATRMKGILLLTDGVPNVEPPRGHEKTLEKYFKDNNFKCGISCYGFGYHLRSDLLLNISNISGGDGFSFIPDASLLGNVFIHGISNLLSTAVTHPLLSISLSKGMTFTDTSTKLNIDIDSLKYGKEKNYVLDVDTTGCSSRSLDYFTDSVEVHLLFGETDIMTTEVNPSRYTVNDYYQQITRMKMIQIINDSLEKAKFRDRSFEECITTLSHDMDEGPVSEYVSNLLYDLNGQVKESLNMTTTGQKEDWFNRWGIHYLRSLQNAYQNEICNNFKDKGVSNFAVGIFGTIRDSVSDVFDELPPPKKDVSVKHTRGGAGLQYQFASSAPPVNMSVYNNASGGCCSEGCHVLMGNYEYKKVEELSKGDKVVTHTIVEGQKLFSVSSIECVIKTKCTDNKVNMVTIGELKITPYHPIILCRESNININNKWKFPITIEQPNIIQCGYMYTFVLENRESMFIEQCIFSTYGHNIIDDVIQHDYFGTNKVIDDLKEFSGYEEGLIELITDSFVRDLETNEIVKIKHDI